MKRRTITRLIKFTHNVLLLTFIYYCVYRPINARVCASGVRTTHAKGDADCLIVWEALQAAGLSPTVVVGEDTDLAVLLLYHCKAEHDIYLTSGSQTNPKVFSIKEGQDKVGKYVCEHILFAHTVSGCDTVPQPFNISKTLPIKRLEKGDRPFCDAAQVFLDPNSNSQDVVTSGEKAFVRMYGGKAEDSLDLLRLVRYNQKLMKNKNKAVQARDLPLTSATAGFQSKRVYFQIQEWATLGQPGLNPEDWGWEITVFCPS